MQDLTGHMAMERERRDSIHEMWGRGDTVIHKVIWEGFAEEVTFELRPRGGEGGAM